MSEGLTVFLPAWAASSTACLAICIPISSSSVLSSIAASSPTLSAPAFFITLYTAASPNSDPDITAFLVCWLVFNLWSKQPTMTPALAPYCHIYPKNDEKRRNLDIMALNLPIRNMRKRVPYDPRLHCTGRWVQPLPPATPTP